MRMQVIGANGVVGGVTTDILRRLGHKVLPVDIVGENCVRWPADAEVTFICTPEDAVPDVIEGLHVCNPGLVVIRSTVLPGTCKDLQAMKGYHVCNIPEHLREVIALNDAWEPFYIVIGQCCEEHGQLLEESFRPLNRPIVRTDPIISEMTKYGANNWLSTVITFWNEMMMLCEKVGVNPHVMSKIVTMDPRISSYGTIMGKGLTGKCLPKDLDNLLEFCESMEFDATLLKTVKEVDGKVKEHMSHQS